MIKVDVDSNNYLPMNYNGFSKIKGYTILHDAEYKPEFKRNANHYVVLYSIRDDLYLVHICDDNNTKTIEGYIIEKDEEIYEHFIQLRKFIKILGVISVSEGALDLENKINAWKAYDKYIDYSYTLDMAIYKIKEEMNVSDKFSFEEYNNWCMLRGLENY